MRRPTARRCAHSLIAAAMVAAYVVGCPAQSSTAAAVDPTTSAAPTTSTTPAAPRAAEALPASTPVLSLRRVPDALALAVGASKLDVDLDAALSNTRLGAVPAASCLAAQVGTGTGTVYPLYSHNPTVALLPASNLKLLTATAALDKLGADDRLTTIVKATAGPAGGTINGNLYLVGGGDPLLRTPAYAASLDFPNETFDNLETLADHVKAAGVTKITGAVVGDESRYDAQRTVATWPSHYLSSGAVGPLSALTVNDGFASFQPTLVPSAQPAQQAAATFTSILQGEGITVTGTPAAGMAPPAAVTITELSSPPLAQVLAEVLRESDNNGAELITKELGRQANPATPTTAAGVAVIQADIAADGLPTAGLHMADGSGLDRSDRVTCQLLLATLLHSGPSGTLAQGLAVAGKSGTLFERMESTPAEGRLRAKTGTLAGVSALSGFVAPPAAAAAAGVGGDVDPSGVAFTFVTNSAPSVAAGNALSDQVGVALAEFPQVPPIADLSPVPAS